MGSWSEDESKVFAGFGRAMAPGREDIERTMLDILPAGRDETFTCVDIGAGAGWLSAAVLRHFPACRVLGLDGSPAMLRAARSSLAPYGERVELRAFRLEEPSWLDGMPPARVFLSCLVLHHLDGPAKRETFARVFEKLEPGGALLLADVVKPRTERACEHAAAAWEEEVRRRSLEIYGDARAHEHFVGARWNMYRYPDPMDKPSTLPEQLRWLEETGYEGTDVFWARAGHAVFGGFKPAS